MRFQNKLEDLLVLVKANEDEGVSLPKSSSLETDYSIEMSFSLDLKYRLLSHFLRSSICSQATERLPSGELKKGILICTF